MAKAQSIHSRSFWLPKQGNSLDEYEDASAHDAARGCFAIADGASASAFVGVWARLLVEGFIRSPFWSRRQCITWLPPLQKEWIAHVGARPLPWYADTKFKEGALATFLGLTITPPPRLAVVRQFRGHLRWRTIAVGDSCLFHVRDNLLLATFPIENSKEFGNDPWLVSSRTRADQLVGTARFRTNAGWCQEGDRFFLMTDALGHWFLQEHEAGMKPWEQIERLLAAPSDNKAFAVWVSGLRERRELRNDDVTLLSIRL